MPGTFVGMSHQGTSNARHVANLVVLVSRGQLQDADSLHRGSGMAKIYQLPEGGHVLRFEDFSVTNGPDLHVLLAHNARIDPNFGRFLHGSVKVASDSRVEEIVWGGVVVDGIPALDTPRMVDPAEADYLVAEERVFGLSLNGDTRAYPARFLDWHEMFNDVVGGEPVSLAY